MNISQNLLYSIVAVLAAVTISTVIVVPLTTNKVIHRITSEYTPGPYAPGFNPDIVNPNIFRQQSQYPPQRHPEQRFPRQREQIAPDDRSQDQWKPSTTEPWKR